MTAATVSKTQVIKTARKIRAEALELIRAVDAWGLRTDLPEGNVAFLGRRLENIDGLAAMLRESIEAAVGAD